MAITTDPRTDVVTILDSVTQKNKAVTTPTKLVTDSLYFLGGIQGMFNEVSERYVKKIPIGSLVLGNTNGRLYQLYKLGVNESAKNPETDTYVDGLGSQWADVTTLHTIELSRALKKATDGLHNLVSKLKTAKTMAEVRSAANGSGL